MKSTGTIYFTKAGKARLSKHLRELVIQRIERRISEAMQMRRRGGYEGDRLQIDYEFQLRGGCKLFANSVKMDITGREP